ncbi:MAG: radical SAM protein [Treponema sp.]
MNKVKKFKKRYYTLVDEYDGSSFLVNTYTRAVAKIFPQEKEDILHFLSDPSDESYKYFSVLYKNGFIVPADLDEISRLHYFYNAQFYDPSNLTVTLLPTLQCNFACPYCFENEHNAEMSLTDIDLFFKTLDGILHAGMNIHISLFGGEPLLSWSKVYPYLKEINNRSKKDLFNYSASITTNGYLLNTLNYDELIYSNIKKIHITLDCNKKNHNSLRSTKSGLPTFDLIISNARDVMRYMLMKNYQSEITFRANLLNNTGDDI